MAEELRQIMAVKVRPLDDRVTENFSRRDA
jgi:hypothetical protein